MFTVTLSLAFTIITLAAVSLTWLQHLKKTDCDCAQDANYKFIMFMCYYVIVMGFVGIFTLIAKYRNMSGTLLRVRQAIGFVNLGLIIALIVIGFKYINILHH